METSYIREATEEFLTEEEYNRRIIEMRNEWIRKKKLALLGELCFLKICQLASFLSVPAIMFIIWDKYFTNDVLYLCGWWVIIGCPVAIAIGAYVGEAIKAYKNNQLRKIYKSAKKKFNKELVKED